MTQKKKKNPYGTKELNPIAAKVRRLIKEQHLTYEKVCVAADVGYSTLMNIFARPKISDMTRRALKYAGIIDEKDEKEYTKWLITKGLL